ncbi:hypothetical protein SOQ14_02015 [Erythrobacter sp. T5W1-R]|nr:hypothetical protein [Erythrobacter sp. T5W1-R]
MLATGNVGPFDQGKPKGAELVDHQFKQVHKAQQEHSNSRKHRIGLGTDGGMILLIIGHLAMAIGADKHRIGIMLSPCDMVPFKGAIISLAAGAANGLVGAELFQSPLFADFAGKFFVSHGLILSGDDPIDLVVFFAAAVGVIYAKQGVGIGFERVGYASGIDHRLADEGCEQVGLNGAQEFTHGSEVLAVQRCLLKIAQGEFDGIAAGDHRHAAGAIIGDAPLLAPPLGKAIAVQKPAKALSGYPGILGGEGLIARLAKPSQRSL